MINLDFENVMQGVGMGSESCFLKSLKENVTRVVIFGSLSILGERKRKKKITERSLSMHF